MRPMGAGDGASLHLTGDGKIGAIAHCIQRLGLSSRAVDLLYTSHLELYHRTEGERQKEHLHDLCLYHEELRAEVFRCIEDLFKK